MNLIIQAVFVLALSLLLVHEMDAIRRQEWKMFVVLKELPDEKAYHIFLLLHVPLYGALLWLLLSGHAVACLLRDGYFSCGTLAGALAVSKTPC